MAHYTRRDGVLARSARVSIGIDVHKLSWHVTALVEDEEVFSGGIPAEYAALKSLLGRFEDCEFRVGYEAGPCGFGLYDALEGDGIKCTVAPPSKIPVEPGSRVKTDRRDSRHLAELVQCGRLKSVFVLSPEQRAHRDLLRTRQQLVAHRGTIMVQIKLKLLFYSLRVPGGVRDTWSRNHLATLRTMPYPYPALRTAIETLVTTFEQLSSQIAALNREILNLARTDMYKERVKLLRTVPGIGLLGAMTILTELGDVIHFHSNEALAAFLGLVPSEYSSGESVHQGHITRCGNARLRGRLVESSWSLIRKDPAMRMKYERIKRFRGGKRAIVAIARTLAGRIRHILLHGEEYILGMRKAARRPPGPAVADNKDSVAAESQA